MKLPIAWLKEWVTVEASAERIAEALTLRGFYVESVETLGHAHPGVVVARVLEVGRHPNADRLTLCRVDDGRAELGIVCGATNVRAGMLVPLATVGARLPTGATIRKSRIRGVESQGMLCSAAELKLSDDAEGIVDLEQLVGGSEALALGRPLDEVLDPPEQVLEVEVPFNRPDGLGLLGLAREVRAALGGSWTEPARSRLSARWSGRNDFDLELLDPEGCPRYIAQVVEGVRVGPSPPWLVRRLATAGQRTVNNVVDLTNLILLEMGQPLHAFDLAQLKGPSIRVRRAEAGEKIVTLDGKERALDAEVLVIADRDRPVAVAGVMGGQDSEVTSGTRSLLLECAWFDPLRVRRGARALGLATEASRRYERGLDPEVGSPAAARFLALLREVSPGFRLGPARERNLARPAGRTLRLRTARCTRLLGVAVRADEAARHLASLDYRVELGDPLVVHVPTWRPDVTHEEDLIEEIGRAHGYDRIPEAPPDTHGVYAVGDPRTRLVERARFAMTARGLDEAWTTSLISEPEALLTAALLDEGEPRLVRLANPMSRDGAVLRPNPVAGLLRACAHNLRQGAAAVRLFEVGVGFRAPDPGAPANSLPDETLMLAALAAGPRFGHAHDGAQQPLDFFDAKGLWEAWLEEMSVDTPEWRAYASPGWKPGASVEVASAASRIGWAGTLGQPLLRDWDIEVPVHLFVVLLDSLPRRMAATNRASMPGRFPPIRRDLAYYVPESVTYRELDAVVRGAAGDWLQSLELFDVYAGPGTPAGMKSLAFTVQFQHPERTLADSEVQTVQDQMSAAVARECGGRLRER
ncbi:MAG TPA: phenylalanine--tRNA ligase subunit beta [Candidatus Eisenbacteria bacterium]